ncbi:uncharacterized protein LOC135952421 [Calliphora vicina]|uniref:uncharacterized protein LOC135952421 n=1 Tax=Calliphora vicina TaxID=7373 RepID=UPI00325A4F33
MASYQIYTIFLLLIFTQSIYCRPADEFSPELVSEKYIQKIKANGTDLEKFVLANMGNYMLIPQKYASKIVEFTKLLLKDATLLDNKQPEVLEFKNKLNLVLDNYNPSVSLNVAHETVDYIFNITQPYLELTDDKQTANSKFIKDLLKKYNFSKIPKKMDDIENEIDERRIFGSSFDKIFIFSMDSLVTIPQQYAANATNATRYLIKDDAFEVSDQSEVLEFKNKLTVFLDKYDPSTSNMKSIYKSMNAFANIIDHYFELPLAQVTEESKFIIELLNKYNCKNVSMPFMKYLETFINNFNVILQGHKKFIGKKYLDQFEEIMTLTKWQEQMESKDEFVDMLKI